MCARACVFFFFFVYVLSVGERLMRIWREGRMRLCFLEGGG